MRLLSFLLLLAAAAPLCRAGDAPPGTPVKRLVIGLWDSRTRPKDEQEDLIHNMLEMPLNYLGMVVKRHDIRKGPPPEAWLEQARCVLFAFVGPGKTPDWLWPWLEGAVKKQHVRVVLFGTYGPLANDAKRLTAFFSHFGLAEDGSSFDGPLGVEAAFVDKRLCAYEADPRVAAAHCGPRNLSAENRPWVTTRSRLEPGVARTPVVTGPWGGLALDPWACSWGGDNDERRWYIQPFEFFREALGLKGVPAPHPAVLNGRRMFFLHIDGDGFESLSTVEPGEYCGKVMYDEVLTKYELPWTASVIIASLVDDLTPKKPTRRMKIASRILMLPQVEAASHGVLHPFLWDEPSQKGFPPGKVAAYAGIAHYTYTRVNEVKDSIDFIDKYLLQDGKKCRVMLWTGDAHPPAESVLQSDAMGNTNLNGGDCRWDQWADSLGFVSPWGRINGDAIQIYAGAANENDFHGFFTTSPGAFGHINTTLERCGSPRILKPADIYIHYYSAERPARLAALKRLIERWGLKEPLAPVFVSTYSEAVRSAITTAKIYRTKKGWAFRDFGACRTVRFDDEKRDVDWKQSKGLIGYRHMGGDLYLSLGGPDADVVLSDSAKPFPCVEQANHVLTDVSLTLDGVSFESKAWSRREVVLAGFPKNAPVVETIDGKDQPDTTDDEGRFRIFFPHPGDDHVSVKIERRTSVVGSK